MGFVFPHLCRNRVVEKNSRIKRIDVYRDYRVHIDFNIDFDQFQFGLDCRRGQEAGKRPA